MKILYPAPVVLMITALAGCASGPSPQTAADLTRAHTLVTSAEQNGAQQYAPAELQSARDKAQQADQLADHDSMRADQLANEASADAQLATARAQNARAQRALEDQRRSLAMLRSEEEQNVNSGAGAAPPTGAGGTPSPSN